MRIFYAAGHSPNPAFKSKAWYHNLYLSLTDLGNEVILFHYDFEPLFHLLKYPSKETQLQLDNLKDNLSSMLLKQIKELHRFKKIDLFFSYFYDAFVYPEVIDEIKSLGIITVNWYCNASYQFDLIQNIAPHYDFCLVPEKKRLANYKAIGANPIYCQEAANPDVYKPYDVPITFDATFLGQAYGERPYLVDYLHRQAIPVHVFGFDWEAFSLENYPLYRRVKRFVKLVMQGNKIIALPAMIPKRYIGGVLDDTAMVQLFSRSKINLGFSCCGETHLGPERILQIRLRDFEVPMSGGR